MNYSMNRYLLGVNVMRVFADGYDKHVSKS